MPYQRPASGFFWAALIACTHAAGLVAQTQAPDPEPAAPAQPVPPDPSTVPAKPKPQAKPERTFSFEQANCAITLPTGWTANNKKPRETFLLGGTKILPQTNFMLASEKIVPHISDSIEMDSAMSVYLVASNGQPDYRTRERVTFAGLEGEAVVIDTGKDKARSRTVVWTGRKGDRVYRLMLERPPATADDKMLAMLKELGAGLTLIDPAYKGDPVSGYEQAACVNSNIGFEADFSKLPGWVAGPSEIALWKDAAFYRYGIVGLLGVTSVQVPEDVDIETASVAALGVIAGASKPVMVEEGKDGNIPWRIYQVTLGAEGLAIARAKIGVDARRIWYVYTWSVVDRPETTKLLDDVVHNVHLIPSDAEGGQRPQAAGLLLNQVGLQCYRKGEFATALRWFQQSLSHRPEEVVLRNVMIAARDAKMYAEGLEALKQYSAKTPPESRETSKLQAELLVGVGDEAAAADVWEKLFAGGFRDDELLDRAVKTLMGASLNDQALNLVEKYASNKRKFETQRADLLAATGRTDEALKILQPATVESGFDWERAEKYVRILVGAGRAREAVATAKLLVEKKPTYARTWYWKARVEEETGRLDLAKQSYQRAKELAPGEQTIAEALERVSSQLGVGDDGLVRTPIDPVTVEQSLLSKPEGLEAISEGRPYRYDYWVTAVRFTPGKPMRKTLYDRAVVLDRSGAEDLSTYSLRFDPARHRLYVNTFDVVTPDGTRRSLDRTTFYVRTGRDASSDRSLIVPVEGLAPGAAIEVVATYEDLGFSESIPFSTRYLADSMPLGRSALVVYAPDGAVNFSATGGLQPTVTAGCTTYVRERCPGEREEPFGPPTDEVVPCVSYGPAGRTWKQEAVDYLDLIKPQLDDATPAAVIEQVKKLVKPDATQREKIETLTTFVQRDLTYKAILFGRKAQIPERPDSTLTKRFGDCKAKSLLLHGLLKAAGVKSSLALLLSEGCFVEGIADRDQFDHMIVYVDELGDDGFIDATNDEAAPLLSAPATLSGRRALILDRDNPRLATIRSVLPAEATVSIRRTVEHGPEKSLVQEDVTVTGRYAAFWRGALDSRDQEQTLQLLVREIEDGGINAHLDKHSFDARRDYSAPLVIHLTYSVPRSKDGSVPVAWPVWERSYGMLPSVQDRKTAFYIKYPLVIESVTRIKNNATPVGGFESVQNPGEVHLSAAADGADTVVTYRLTRTPGTYPSADYGTFRDAINQGLATFGQPAK